MKKEVEISYEEGEGLEKVSFKGTVTLKRLSWGESNAMEKEASDIKFFGNVPQMSIDSAKLKVAGLLKSIIACTLTRTAYYEDNRKEIQPSSAPYYLDAAGLASPDFPRDIGDKLFEAFTELNQVSDKKKAG